MSTAGPTRITADGRTVVFGPGAIESAGDLLGTGYTLLTTARAAASAPALAAGAAAVVHVPSGLVEDAAGALRGSVPGDRWVALGGGRVIDVAKALAAADPPRRLVAVPTTLSAAEMTRGHRHAPGVDPGAPRVRPQVVINDPGLSASAPEAALAAGTANALGHALAVTCAVPADTAVAARAAEALALLARGWAGAVPDRPALARGAMLAGWALDGSGLGLHHALAQTAVRVARLGHAEANAAMLPESTAALRRRRPAPLAAADRRAGTDLDALARMLRTRSGGRGIAILGEDAGLRARAVAAVLTRPEPSRVPPAPGAAEIDMAYMDAARAVSGDGRPG